MSQPIKRRCPCCNREDLVSNFTQSDNLCDYCADNTPIFILMRYDVPLSLKKFEKKYKK